MEYVILVLILLLGGSLALGETGTTLKENNLDVIAEIMPISAHLIANKASFRFKSDKIEVLKRSLSRRDEK